MGELIHQSQTEVDFSAPISTAPGKALSSETPLPKLQVDQKVRKEVDVPNSITSLLYKAQKEKPGMRKHLSSTLLTVIVVTAKETKTKYNNQ